MKALPADAIAYRRTTEFTAASTPTKLRHAHQTKVGVWGKIVVLAGSLTYHILTPVLESITLTPAQVGIIEPTVKHKVIPSSDARFYVEFYRSPQPVERCSNL